MSTPDNHKIVGGRFAFRRSDTTLPGLVLHRIVNEGDSALRAWRCHLGLSLHDVFQLTGIKLPVLLAIDDGEVPLCEWTVKCLTESRLGITSQELLLTVLHWRLGRSKENFVGYILRPDPSSAAA